MGSDRVRFNHPGDITIAKLVTDQEKLKRKLERNGKVFKFINFDVKLVRHVLEQNGFIDADDLSNSDHP